MHCHQCMQMKKKEQINERSVPRMSGSELKQNTIKRKENNNNIYKPTNTRAVQLL